MHIWVDADACPAVIKDILYRAAQRCACHLTLVANQLLRTPPSPWLHSIQVPSGFDVADDYIVQHVKPDDLVITGDIPLAAQALEHGARVLSPRGEVFTADTIAERLSMRDMLESMRSAGIETGGPAALNQADRRQFASALDRVMLAAQRARGGVAG